MPKRSETPGLYATHYRTTSGERRVNSWMYQAPRKDKQTPRPKPVRLGTKDKEQAIGMVGEIIARAIELDRSDHIERLLEQAINEKCQGGDWGEKTARDARSSVRKLIGYTGDVQPQYLSADRLTEWFRQMNKDGLSGATAHHHLRIIRALFSKLIEMGKAFNNPASNLRLPTHNQSKREKFCSLEQRNQIIESCTRTDLLAVFLLGFHLGLRIGEIINATPEWLTIQGEGEKQRGHLTVASSEDWKIKNQKDRSIPLTRELLAFFEAHPPEGAFIIKPDVRKGRDFLRWNPRRPFTDHVEACELGWVTPHTMRHTFGSLHTIAGTPELKIRRWMGISSKTFEAHYAGLDPHDDEINL